MDAPRIEDQPPRLDAVPREPPAARVQELFPELFFTLLSIIQGAAFVYLCERVLSDPSGLPLVGWLEAAATLTLIVFVWHRVVIAVLAFYWTPTFADAALPFVLGAVELLLAHTVGSESAPWLGAMALVWAVILVESIYIDTRIFRVAGGIAARPSRALIRRSFLMSAAGVLVPVSLLVVTAAMPSLVPWVGPAVVFGLVAVFVALGIAAPGRF